METDLYLEPLCLLQALVIVTVLSPMASLYGDGFGNMI